MEVQYKGKSRQSGMMAHNSINLSIRQCNHFYDYGLNDHQSSWSWKGQRKKRYGSKAPVRKTRSHLENAFLYQPTVGLLLCCCSKVAAIFIFWLEKRLELQVKFAQVGAVANIGGEKSGIQSWLK
jgi:hypothetical protein